MSTAIDFINQYQMDDFVAKLLEDDPGELTVNKSDKSLDECAKELGNISLFNDKFGILGGIKSSFDTHQSIGLWRVGPTCFEKNASKVSTTWDKRTKVLGSSGSSPDSQGSCAKEAVLRRHDAFMSYNGSDTASDFHLDALSFLGPWLGQPPPSSAAEFETFTPKSDKKKFLPSTLSESFLGQFHPDTPFLSNSTVVFDTSVPPPNMMGFIKVPPPVPFSVPPPSLVNRDQHSSRYAGLPASAMKDSRPPAWKIVPPPIFSPKTTTNRQHLRPGSFADMSQRIEECRYKLKLLNLERQKTENDLRSEFGDIRFNAYGPRTRFLQNQSSIHRLLHDLVKQHAWVAALIVSMKMIQGEQTFLLQFETLLDEWMEAIKDVEMQRVKLGNMAEESVMYESIQNCSYSAICESLEKQGNFCRKLRTALWCALQSTLAIKASSKEKCVDWGISLE